LSDRVAILTNFVGPYRPALFQQLARRCGELRVLVSGGDGPTGTRPVEWAGLPIRAQRNISFKREWRHPHEFRENLTIHVPYDTIPQLFQFRPSAIVTGELGMRTLQATIFKWFAGRTRLVIWATVSEITEQGRGWVRPLLRRVLLRSADAVIVNGDSGARYVRRFGVDAKRIFRVPQTTEIAPFLQNQVEKDEPSRHRLLYCGRLIPFKGLVQFVALLSQWCRAHRSHKTELWVAGDGPVKRDLRLLPLPPNLSIRMLGHVSYERLPEVYRECGVLAFPTLADEWGLVVVEAMASGLPILGSQYSQAVEDLVIDGQNGWVFRPDRVEEVLRGLDSALCASGETLETMGMRARKRVQAMTPSDMADRMMTAVRYALHAGTQSS